MSQSPHRAVILRAPRRKFAARAFALALALLGLSAAGAQAHAQQILPYNVVISQVYARGGEAGATFRSDYVELFNRGNAPVDINGFALEVVGMTNGFPSATVITVTSTSSITLQPGRYLLIELARGSNGQPLPSPDFPSFGSFAPNLSATGGYVALYRRAPTVNFGSCPTGDDLVDVVGYGTSVCREGQTTVPAPGLTQAILRARQGCNDTQLNATDFQLGDPNPRNSQTPAVNCFDIVPGPSVIQFAAPQFTADEPDGRAPIILTRFGDTNAPATVEVVATDGTANDRQDYTTAWGTVRFEPGETSKTFDVLLTNDAAVEGTESLQLSLSNPTGLASLGQRSTASLVIHDHDINPSAPNPNDESQNFVRQHYHDFFNREPDAGGLQFWTQNIESCGADQACRAAKRIDTSAAFFLSIEFQGTGYFVHRLNRVAFADSQTRVRGLPTYREFVRDTRAIGEGVVVNQGDWQLRLQQNQRLFSEAFAQRPEFLARYPESMSNLDYVNALNQNAGGVIPLDQRLLWVVNLNSGGMTRAEVLRMVAENRQFFDAEKNRAFVLMQYFGYLRRNPPDAPELTLDYQGYDFWLGKLNDHGGDYAAAEMVKSFLVSQEYRRRFSANPTP